MNTEHMDTEQPEPDDSGRRDHFELVHGFVTASREGELTECEIADFEQLLRENAAVRRLYSEYLEVTLALPALLARDKASPDNKTGQAETGKTSTAPISTTAPIAQHLTPSSSWFWSNGRTTLFSLAGLFLAAGFLVAGGLAAWTILWPNAVPSERAAPQYVARLILSDGCHWLDEQAPPEAGGALAVGRSLHLASGIAEVQFDIGARVILQGPASFGIESPSRVRLTLGKLTAEITTPEARGFTVLTPDATMMDQGTEFGVEVAPSGSHRVHVFKGEVDLTVNAKPGKVPSVMQKLTANSAARLEHKDSKFTLYEETGESFVRSMAQRDRDRHVVAYWRFEDHRVGDLVPDTQGNTSPICGTVDSSFNGNDLFTYAAESQPQFSEDIPAKLVPQSGQPNTRCLDNTHWKEWATRDVYTRSAFSHAAPLDIQKITPTQWTIEASVKAVNWKRGVQTFVGRDGAPALPVVDVPPRLAFQVTAEGHFAVSFLDENNRLHQTVEKKLDLLENHWYNVAAQSDGRWLSLYVDALDGQGYHLQARTELPTTGSTALGNGSNDAEWSIGRGKVAGFPDQWFEGWIDEVRICDIALDPSEFLFAPELKK